MVVHIGWPRRNNTLDDSIGASLAELQLAKREVSSSSKAIADEISQN
jgi:hypothetical protein